MATGYRTGREVRYALTLAMLVMPQLMRGQTATLCPSGVFFSFQTSREARFVADSTLAVYPMPVVPHPANLAQFVVDTSGAVVDSTFRFVVLTDHSLAAEARAILGRWHFTPAMVGACPVNQLVLTPIGRDSTVPRI